MLGRAPEIGADILLAEDEKKKRKYNFLLQRKRRRKNEPSDITKVIKEISKQRLKDGEKIKNFLKAKYENISEDNMSLYTAIISSKVKNGKIIINERVCKKKLYSNLYFYNLSTQCLSNDGLLLESIYIQERDKAAKAKTIDEYTNRLLDAGDVCWMRVVSPAYVINGNIEKGYYQDFSDDYAFIGLNLTTKESRDLILACDKRMLKGDMNYNNVEYNIYGDKIACMIVPKKAKNDTINKNYNNMKILNPKKKKFAIELKSSTLVNQVKFLDTKFIKETFCPAYLGLPIPFLCNIQVHIEYNYNDLFQQLDDLVKETGGGVQFPPNTFYWDTMEDFMRFMAIISLTMPNLSEEWKKDMGAKYDKYLGLKDVFAYAGKIYPIAVDVMTSFYLSFTNKIEYDRILSLDKKAHEALTHMDVFTKMAEFKDAISFVNNLGDAAINIFRQFSEQFHDTFKECVACIDKIKAGSGTNLVNDLQHVCQKIYLLSYCGEEGHVSCMSRLLPAGGFLAGISKGPIDKNIFKKALDIKFDKMEDLAKAEREKTEMYTNIMRNLHNYQQQILVNTVNAHIKSDDPYYAEKRDYVRSALIEGLTKDLEAQNIVNQFILETVSKTGSITNEYIKDEKFIEKYLNEWMAKEKLRKDAKKEKIRKYDEQIAILMEKIRREKGAEDRIVSLYSEVDYVGGSLLGKINPKDFVDKKDVSQDTKDLVNQLDAYHKYMQTTGGKGGTFYVGPRESHKKLKPGKEFHKYMAGLIFSSNAYPDTFEDLMKQDPYTMVKSHPLAYAIVDTILYGGYPTLEEYFNEDAKIHIMPLNIDKKEAKAANEQLIKVNMKHTGKANDA